MFEIILFYLFSWIFFFMCNYGVFIRLCDVLKYILNNNIKIKKSIERICSFIEVL